MAAKQIGSAAVVLSANADGLVSGLTRAAGDVKKWAGTVGGTVGGQAKSAGISIADGIRGGVGFALGKAGLDGLGSAVSGLVDEVRETARMGNFAQALGLSAEEFTGVAGLAKSFGEDTKEFIESLVTLRTVADQAASGTGEAALTFFRDLNLEAASFSRLNSRDQFLQFFDAVSKLGDQGLKVKSIMTAFGTDGGKLLLPLLSRSPAQLREMAKGFEVSGEKMRQVTWANEALNRAQVRLQTLWRDMAVAAAPVLEFLAGELEVLAGHFPKLDKAGTDSLTRLIRLAATLSDTFKGLSAFLLKTTGIMLEHADKMIILFTTLHGAKMGGKWGALAGAAAGAGVVAGLQADGVLEPMKELGGVMREMGGQMAADVGKSAERAEAFLKKLEERRKQAIAGSAAAPSPAAAAAAPKVWEPAKFAGAVRAGSEEAYRLTIRNLYGDFVARKDDMPKQQLGALKDIKTGVGKVAVAVERLGEQWETV